jgi:hypothetical protein
VAHTRLGSPSHEPSAGQGQVVVDDEVIRVTFGCLDDQAMNGAGGTRSDVVLSDGEILLRPWKREDAQFLADASAGTR